MRLHAPLLLSDVHLCSARPRTTERLLALLAAPGEAVRELVILGDLFEYWAGDDALAQDGPDDRIACEVAQALRRLAEGGMPVYLMHGNRDLLLGVQFLQASGAQLLADPCVALVGAGQGQGLELLLSHGDAYCTLDLPYQAFRRQAREPMFQAAFLARPLEQRRALLGQARMQSEAGKQQKAEQIMDVTPEAIAAAMRAAGVRHMLHGHTHRPARHEFELDGAQATRWVLPDWDLDATPPRGGGLRWSGGDLQPFDA